MFISNAKKGTLSKVPFFKSYINALHDYKRESNASAYTFLGDTPT